MRDADALLAAVLADPESDAPRLVYADWLQEHGDPDRAEFVRLQIGAVNTDRERRLLAKHRQDWVGPIADWCGAWEFRRGFLEAVTIDGEQFAARAAELFARAPLLRRVKLQYGGRGSGYDYWRER